MGLALLAVLVLAAGEVLGRPAAENAIALAVEDRYQLPKEPSVDIEGFPFLVRTALGSVPAVTVTFDEYRAGELLLDRFSLRLQQVRFRLIRLLRGDSDVTAERGAAEAVVRDRDLTEYLRAHGLPMTVSFAEARVTVEAAGVTAAGNLHVEEGQLRFTPSQEPFDLLSFSVPVPDIAGIRLTGVAVGRGFVSLSADVTGYVVPKLNN